MDQKNNFKGWQKGELILFAFDNNLRIKTMRDEELEA